METQARQFSMRYLLVVTTALATLVGLYKTGTLLFAQGGLAAMILVVVVMLVSFLLMLGIFFSRRR